MCLSLLSYCLMKSVDLETKSGVLGCLAIDVVSIVLRDSYRSLMNFMQVHTFVVFYDVHRLTAQPVCYWMCQNVCFGSFLS